MQKNPAVKLYGYAHGSQIILLIADPEEALGIS
jgi:hypothetical protein